ncbi:uncharacterized protein LOC115442099 [Manduca sexta]|uniref:uncharacterized protein LOC115442099 n=1 Tax=Manduca sexta TaxID=7130 RepID=UPI00188FEFF3|nr:uncharacterized protein LOC115442099 [Manduca sexta]
MYYILILQIIFVSCQDFPLYNTDDMIIENLRKREVIPLNQINRRLFRSNEQIRYRRTKDVQEDLAERKLDKVKSQLREARINNAKLDKLHQQLKWMTIDDNEAIGTWMDGLPDIQGLISAPSTLELVIITGF